MKKKYLNPAIEIIEVKLQQMIAESIPTGGTFDPNNEEVGSRQYYNEEWED